MKSFIVALFTLCVISISSADDIGIKWTIDTTVTVGTGPGQYGSIQAAVEGCHAAGGGWQINISAGTWPAPTNYIINGSSWGNKCIAFFSETDIPEICIIEGNQSEPCLNVFDANVWIQGITIRNGGGTEILYYDHPYDPLKDIYHRIGGGLAIRANDWVVIDNCIIENNHVTSANDQYKFQLGGGVFIDNVQGSFHKILTWIKNCKFINNKAYPEMIVPDAWANSAGGGLYCTHIMSSSKIAFCTFEENMSDDKGGALYISNSSKINVEYNEFYHNYTSCKEGLTTGMAINAVDFNDTYGELILRNNMICNNEKKEEGDSSQADALGILNVPKLYMTNNTIADNDCSNSSAVIIQSYGDDFINPKHCYAEIYNNIFYDNTVNLDQLDRGYQLKLWGLYDPFNGYGAYLHVGLAKNSIEGQSLKYDETYETVDINYGWDPPNEIWVLNDDWEPGFRNASENDFRIDNHSESYCDDAGISPTERWEVEDAYIPRADFEKDRRPLDSDGDGFFIWDIGADEYNPDP